MQYCSDVVIPTTTTHLSKYLLYSIVIPTLSSSETKMVVIVNEIASNLRAEPPSFFKLKSGLLKTYPYSMIRSCVCCAIIVRSSRAGGCSYSFQCRGHAKNKGQELKAILYKQWGTEDRHCWWHWQKSSILCSSMYRTGMSRDTVW
jgi:hypothetical protein